MGVYDVEVHGTTTRDGVESGILMKVVGVSNFVEEYRLPKGNPEKTSEVIKFINNMGVSGCPRMGGYNNQCDGEHQYAQTQAIVVRGELKPPTKSGAKAGQPRDPAVDYNYYWNFEGLTGSGSTETSATQQSAPKNTATAPTGPSRALTEADISGMRAQMISNNRTALMNAVAFNGATVEEVLETATKFSDWINGRTQAIYSPLVSEAIRQGAEITEIKSPEVVKSADVSEDSPVVAEAPTLTTPSVKNREELDAWVLASGLDRNNITSVLNDAGYKNSQEFMAENLEGGIQGLANFIFEHFKNGVEGSQSSF